MGNKRLKNLIRSSLFLAMAIAFQVLGKNVPAISQSIVGPAVNAVLLLTTSICGISWGIAIGALTPLLAWISGQLAGPMGPFIPFIMVGNMIYVVCFGLVKKRQIGKYAGLVIGAFAKYIFLYLSASRLISIFNLGIPKKLAEKLVVMMGIPQLITALIGGVAALVIIEILLRRRAIDI